MKTAAIALNLVCRQTCERGQVAELKTWVVLRSSQVKTTWGNMISYIDGLVHT